MRGTTHKGAHNVRGHVHPAECDGLGEMSGPVPETLTSIHNKTGWNLLFWHRG